MGYRCVLCVLGTLLLAATSSSQTISLPAKVFAESGDLAPVRIEWTGSDFRYVSSPGLNVIREYDPDPQVMALMVSTNLPGQYRILCVASSKKSKARISRPALSRSGKAPIPPPPIPQVPPEPSGARFPIPRRPRPINCGCW